MEMDSAFQIGTVRGIPIRLHWSLFIIFFLLAWSLALGYTPELYPDINTGVAWLLGAATAAVFLLSILLHELGHALVGQREGVRTRRITLFIFGGIAELEEEPKTGRSEFRIAIAGPVVSLSLAVIFFVVSVVMDTLDLRALQAAFAYLSITNLLLGIFNLIPGFPLDGGRVLRALVWQRTGDRRRADRVAVNSGQIVGFIFFAIATFLILTGYFLNGLWIGAIGWFIQSAAMQTQAQSTVQNMLEGVRVGQVMSTQIDTISSRMMVRQLIEEYVLGQGKRFFVVSDGEGPPRGIVTLSNLSQVPRDRWDWTPALQVMVPWRQVVTVTPDTQLLDALQRLSELNLNQVPVVQGDQIVGVLSREMIIRYIQLRAQLETGGERADLIEEQRRRYAEAQ